MTFFLLHTFFYFFVNGFFCFFLVKKKIWYWGGELGKGEESLVDPLKLVSKNKSRIIICGQHAECVQELLPHAVTRLIGIPRRPENTEEVKDRMSVAFGVGGGFWVGSNISGMGLTYLLLG
jgi:hypothetical protein